MNPMFDGVPEPPSPHGYTRRCPYGCVESGLLSLLTFLPGQAMRPHRHLDSDEYFTALCGDAAMIVDGDPVLLPQGHTFLRRRGVLHALRNESDQLLVVQSFQTPLPSDAMTEWVSVDWWGRAPEGSCPRCWCGHLEGDRCANCGLRLTGYNEAKSAGGDHDRRTGAAESRRRSQTGPGTQ